jgi:cobalamin biosynthesis Mg chelatase CobN
MGWSATTGQVQPWVYQQLTETFVLDPAMRERLAEAQSHRIGPVANRLLEAHRRQYWQPDAKTLEPCSGRARNWKTASRAFTNSPEGCRMNDIVSVPLSELKRAGPAPAPARPTARAACRCSSTRT